MKPPAARIVIVLVGMLVTGIAMILSTGCASTVTLSEPPPVRY